MKFLLTSSAVAMAFAISPAFAQQPPPPAPAAAQSGAEAPPEPDADVTVETTIKQTPDATVETRTEVIRPVSGRPEIDLETPISPEVQAVVDSGESYTTEDIVLAQLEAIKATPVSRPTTVIQTTATTPNAPAEEPAGEEEQPAAVSSAD